MLFVPGKRRIQRTIVHNLHTHVPELLRNAPIKLAETSARRCTFDSRTIISSLQSHKQSENGISVTLVVFCALIPPCAAICARRGESWKKRFYVISYSANVAEAEPPANPVPTTITSRFRLLAGLTRLIWFYNLSICPKSDHLEFWV
jgi:hypothetical protein